nr:Heat shock 70 kDa protein 12A [Polyrhizophydium stewartii]
MEVEHQKPAATKTSFYSMKAYVLQDWETVKRSYAGPASSPEKQDDRPELIQLPNGILKYVPDDVKTLWEQEHGDGVFGIPPDEMQAIFDGPVESTIRLVHKQLEVAAGCNCDYLVLVGGFASSPYLAKRVRDEFAGTFKQVIVPNDPTAAVVRGAVLYGANPILITRRCARNSYGYITNIQLSLFDGANPKDIWARGDGVQYVKVFKCLVAENQPVSPNEEFEAVSYVMKTATGGTLDIDLLSTPTRLEPGKSYSLSSVDNAAIVGHISAKRGPVAEDQKVVIAFTFGSTEITVKASVEQTGEELVTRFVP